MLKSKSIDRICIIVMSVALVVTILFMNGETIGITPASVAPGYETRLFDKSKVHTIDIIIDDWDAFLDTAAEEEYSSCTLVIDGEKFSNVAIRAKGNNSRRLTEKYGHDRYSLKIEFDHYTFGSYHGLDKFSLDSSFQDNSYMKTWIAFDMMEHMGVPTPLCSYTWVRVNGEDWGLFLAVEEPEEAFAKRNFGTDYGQLYKPDYKSLNAENADVHLRYTDDNFDSYDNIFRKAKFDITDADKQRVINALKILATGDNLETAINIDEVLRYFTVQVFVVNMDSYLGRTGHNYFLYEEDGILSILPWDYNLAFATYSLGMPDPINDSTLYVNYPINTPASGEIMKKRPLYHNLMKNNEHYSQYHEYFDELIESYFESGYFEAFIEDTFEMISPNVEAQPRDAECRVVAGKDHLAVKGELERLGYKYLGEYEQAKWQYVLELKGQTAEGLFNEFRSGHRWQIRRAEKDGVRVRELAEEELGILKAIAAEAGERHGFLDPELEYYRSMKEYFGKQVKFVVAEMPAAKLRTEREKAEGPEVTVEDGEMVPLAAAMFVNDGREMVYLYSGSARKYQKYGGAHLIQWEMIQEALATGCERYNFYGVRPVAGDGVYKFKQGFRGHVEELLGTFALPVGALGKVYVGRIAEKEMRGVR